MAFDHRALISGGFWTADDATASEAACLLLSFGLLSSFSAETVAVIIRGLGRFGFAFVMDR